MNSNRLWAPKFALTTVAVCLALSLCANAQVQTTTSTTKEAPTVTTTVTSGEVVYVNGRDLIVKLDDGTLKHFSNVPDSVRIAVDGKQLGIHDLKVGMHVQRTVVKTSTPQIVTTTKTVTGTVFYVQPPINVILTLEDGTNQRFNIPKGQKFNVDGQTVDAWGLRKGMKISATQVVEQPETVIAQQQQITGTMPPPPPPPAPEEPIIVAVLEPAPAPAPEPAALPKTGSPLPLIGLLGVLSVAGSLALKAARS